MGRAGRFDVPLLTMHGPESEFSQQMPGWRAARFQIEIFSETSSEMMVVSSPRAQSEICSREHVFKSAVRMQNHALGFHSPTNYHPPHSKNPTAQMDGRQCLVELAISLDASSLRPNRIKFSEATRMRDERMSYFQIRVVVWAPGR